MLDYQSQLFPYAYNILGSVEDAKDAIQDVLLKYSTLQVTPENEKNYLIKSVVNRSLNIKRKNQKLQISSTWLPVPVATEAADLRTELREMVSYSLLFLLERLKPKERAVFILREAFAYTHQEIGEVLGITAENSRKLLSRASEKIRDSQKPSNKLSNLKRQFANIDKVAKAIQTKDLPALHQLLSEEIQFYADGGTKVKVVKQHLSGLIEVADILVLTYHKFQSKYHVRPALINHQPALLYFYKDNLKVCQVFEFDDSQKVRSISVIVDPEKLPNLKNPS